MKRKFFIATSVLLGAFFLFSLSGCKVTGGGWICSEPCPGPTTVSTVDTVENGPVEECKPGEINFGLVFNDCGPDGPKGNFNYNDKAYPVKMDGEFEYWLFPWTAFVSYTSKEKESKGETGYAIVKVEDLGEGSEDHGRLKIIVLSGPFGGYHKSGVVKGNIQEHECED